MNGVTERVKRGAALLDEKDPGWWGAIDLGKLDLRSKCDCVLGQLGAQRFGTTLHPYIDGLSEIARLSPLRAPDYGFDTGIDPDDYEHGSVEDGEEAVRREFASLTEAWRDLITRRQELAAAPA